MKISNNPPARAIDFSDIREGDKVFQNIHFQQNDLDRFRVLSGDSAAMHFDPAFASNRGFEKNIVHGLLVTSKFSRLLGMHLPGENSIIQSINFSFMSPVYLSQELLYVVSVVRVVQSVNAVLLDLKASNGDTVFVQGKAQCVCVVDGNNKDE